MQAGACRGICDLSRFDHADQLIRHHESVHVVQPVVQVKLSHHDIRFSALADQYRLGELSESWLWIPATGAAGTQSYSLVQALIILGFSVQFASPSRLEQSLLRILMPRARQTQHPADCDCCAQPTPAGQSIEELDFLRSACTLAQAGNQTRLAAFIDAHPACVNEDGCGGGLLIRLMQAMLKTPENIFEDGAVHVLPATCC